MSNEQEVERYLQRFAKERGFEFVLFYHAEYDSLQKTMELWSSAAIVVGPHGGAFANIAFAPKGTLVMEFLPNGSIFHSPAFKEHLSTYQQAMALGHRYYPIMSTYVKNDDMVVNVRDVLSTLEKALGKEKKHLK